jgi:hypothetical protein
MGVIFRILDYVINLLTIFGTLSDDGYATFNSPISTGGVGGGPDVAFTFSGFAKSIQVYTSDEDVRLGFDQVVDADSMLVPKDNVITIEKPVKVLYVVGTSAGGTLSILSSNLNEGKSDEELRQELPKRKL